MFGVPSKKARERKTECDHKTRPSWSAHVPGQNNHPQGTEKPKQKPIHWKASFGSARDGAYEH